MEKEVMNRMEMDGPNRGKTIKELLKQDRDIMCRILVGSCNNVLKAHYGWDYDQLKEFNKLMSEEIDGYKG